jgi:hypothetical protein
MLTGFIIDSSPSVPSGLDLPVLGWNARSSVEGLTLPNAI